MPKEKKRTGRAEAAAPAAPRLEPRPRRRNPAPRQGAAEIPRGQFFSPELIRRIAERIRNL